MQQNKLIAVTGGIGSGKSTVISIIKSLGYPVLSCDEEYATLLNNGTFNELFIKNFGDVIDTNGQVNRKVLSSIVFNDKEKLRLLNEITHPVIMQSIFDKAKNYPVAFVEVQLLFESNLQDEFTDIIIIKRNLLDRISSVMKRSNLKEEEVLQRIRSQFNYESINEDKYYVLQNDFDERELKYEVIKLLQKILG